MNNIEQEALSSQMIRRKVKSFKTAALLLVFLGSLGGDQFYLGNTKRGIIKLVCTLTFILMPITAILNCLDLVRLVDTVDKANGIPQQKLAGENCASNQEVYKLMETLDEQQQNRFLPLYLVQRKKYTTFAIIWICVGWLGIDQFYLGKYKLGFFKLFCGITLYFLLISCIISIWNLVHAIRDIEAKNAEIIAAIQHEIITGYTTNVVK